MHHLVQFIVNGTKVAKREFRSMCRRLISTASNRTHDLDFCFPEDRFLEQQLACKRAHSLTLRLDINPNGTAYP